MLSPARLELQISELILLKAGGLQISENMRVMGDKGTDSTELVQVPPLEQELERSILAVLYPPEAAASNDIAGEELPPSLQKCNAAGFLYVVSVDVEQDSLVVLAPAAGALPSNYLLVGSLKWDDKN